MQNVLYTTLSFPESGVRRILGEPMPHAMDRLRIHCMNSGDDKGAKVP